MWSQLPRASRGSYLGWEDASSSPHVQPRLPALTTRVGSALSMESTLCGSEASTLRLNTSSPEAPKPEVDKLLILFSPSGTSKTPIKGKDPSLCWGLTASVLPRLESGFQAGPGTGPSSILRPRRSHQVPRLSET